MDILTPPKVLQQFGIMTILVLIYNLLFGIACLLVAKKIWAFKCRLSTLADQILGVEQAIHRVLYPAPNAIIKAKTGTRSLRDRYQQAGIQYERVQQILGILSLAQLILRYGNWFAPRSPAVPRSPKSR